MPIEALGRCQRLVTSSNDFLNLSSKTTRTIIFFNKKKNSVFFFQVMLLARSLDAMIVVWWFARVSFLNRAFGAAKHTENAASVSKEMKVTRLSLNSLSRSWTDLAHQNFLRISKKPLLYMNMQQSFMLEVAHPRRAHLHYNSPQSKTF